MVAESVLPMQVVSSKPWVDFDLPVRELSNWAAVVAVSLLALNDHYLKMRFGNWWTGKLSDFAGLFVLPLVLTATWNSVGLLGKKAPKMYKYPLTKKQLIVACVVSAVYFAAINISSAMSQWLFELPLNTLYFQLGMAKAIHVVDTEDLVAIPAVLLAYNWGKRYIE